MTSMTELYAADAGSKQGDLHTLGKVAQLANILAKQLTGSQRALAYRIKTLALNALILEGAVRVNGVRANAILCLDILGDPIIRLHIPISFLQPEARVLMRRTITQTQAKAPISERLGNQLRSLQQKSYSDKP